MYLLFAFFSGFTSLVYEIIWMRYLVLVLGNTVQATALTVAVFIAGLGIGAIIFGRAADRSKNHLKLFSKIQFGAGISSLLTLFVLSNLPKIYMFFNNQEIVFSRLLTLSLGCSFILIPAIFTGGAFPALAKGLIRQKKMIRRQLGLIYSVNTFGSIIGIFVTAFALIRLIGMAGAQIVAILLSFLIAIGAYFRSSVTDSNENHGTSVTVRGSEMLPTKYVIIAFIVGFNSLGLEILWTRIINIYLPNTTYGFATVLIIFLCGISLGSYVYGRFLSSRFNAHFLLAFSQMMIGFYILLSTLIVNKIPLLLVIFKPIMNIAMIRLFLPGITVIAVLSFIPTVWF